MALVPVFGNDRCYQYCSSLKRFTCFLKIYHAHGYATANQIYILQWSNLLCEVNGRRYQNPFHTFNYFLKIIGYGYYLFSNRSCKFTRYYNAFHRSIKTNHLYFNRANYGQAQALQGLYTFKTKHYRHAMFNRIN
jgi:hypothetical protein